MKHDILGEITQSDCDPFDAAATIQHGSRDVQISMNCDDQSIEATLNYATEVVRRLAELDNLAKLVAVADLREIYNNAWNEYDEGQEDGSFKTISNPQLSEAEFAAKLSLTDVHVSGNQAIDFYYDDENMFWGHAIVVNSPNGMNLQEAWAELFG
jgi:hypothetical protein